MDDIPWRDYMEMAFGILCLLPETFWNLTMEEFIALLEGKRRANPNQLEAVTPEELEELMQKFPDRTN